MCLLKGKSVSKKRMNKLDEIMMKEYNRQRKYLIEYIMGNRAEVMTLLVTLFILNLISLE